MKWLIQEFLDNNPNFIRMMHAIEATRTNFLLVRLNHDNSLTIIDPVDKLPLDQSETVLEEFTKNDRVMVYGSKTFANIAKVMNLKPGSFLNRNFEFDVIREILGSELLNNEFIIGDLFSLQPIAEHFFIRPTGNTKLFTGMTVSKEDFLDWQKRERSLSEKSPYVNQSLLISPVQEILSEYRFFVVNQEIVTSSSYQVNHTFNTTQKPSNEMLYFTRRIIDKFPIAKAFVVDIAKTKNGFKVVEYNNINSSGLYTCDEVSIVEAINNLI
jgi:hypothetical protein